MKKSRRKFVKEIGIISAGTIILPGLELTAKNISLAEKINIPGGFASCAGAADKGWYAASLVMNDKNTGFPLIKGTGTEKYKFEESKVYKNIAQKPPGLQCKTDGRTLIWDDMHVHSAYSKCIASMNGIPDEVFRYQRDILQNEVLCSLEHSHFLKWSEQKYVFDLLEAEASDKHIVIFGDEPGILQGRHTDFYSFKRHAMEQLRNIDILFERDRSRIYKAIKAYVKKDDLLVTRHSHGNLYPAEKEMLDSFDPQLECSFKAMQGRTNAMMEESFTNDFMNGGKKVGL